jgi:hypothetical protein
MECHTTSQALHENLQLAYNYTTRGNPVCQASAHAHLLNPRTAGFGLATTMGIAMLLLPSTHPRGNSAPSNKETARHVDSRATSSGLPVNPSIKICYSVLASSQKLIVA